MIAQKTAELVLLPAKPDPDGVERLFRAAMGYRPSDIFEDTDLLAHELFVDPDRLRDLMKWLYPRQISVLVLRYGLAGGLPATRAPVAEALGISVQRVRQHEMRGLAILRYEVRRQLNGESSGTPIHSLFGDATDDEVRLSNTLRRGGVRTIEDLLTRTEEQLLRLHYIGPASLSRIKNQLSARGYQPLATR